MIGMYASGSRKHKRDGNHGPIARRLEELGASVFDLSAVGRGLSDLLVGFCGATFLVEIKMPNGTLTPSQVEFARTWRGAKPVEVRSVDEAQAWYLRTREDLTRRAA
jgi:hypothetical protein